MPDPRVTVLMTVYNGLAYLPAAVESVLAQRFSDFEFLIVEDASTDGSAEWLERVRDARVRLERNARNRGQVWSLNRGLSLARGEYVARLDQDDVCRADRLARQVAWLDRRPDAAAVGTLMAGIDIEGRRNGWLLGRRQENYGSFAASLLLGLTPVCHPSVMFRRRLVQELGGYDESFAPAEDVELWARLAARRGWAGVIAEPLVLSRMHPGQQSVLRAEAQQRHLWRAQERLLARVCPMEQRLAMAALWRRDPSIWQTCGSVGRWVGLCEAWRAMVDAFGFSREQRASFVRMSDRWLGPGVRLGSAMAGWPAWLFYPSFMALSPLLVPAVRERLSRAAGRLRRARSAVAAERPAPAAYH